MSRVLRRRLIPSDLLNGIKLAEKPMGGASRMQWDFDDLRHLNVWGHFRFSALNSHNRAMAQSRLAVRGDISRTAPTFSDERPLIYRNSITWASLESSFYNFWRASSKRGVRESARQACQEPRSTPPYGSRRRGQPPCERGSGPSGCGVWRWTLP